MTTTNTRNTANTGRARFLAPETHQRAAGVGRRVVVMNGSRIEMVFELGQWWNVSVSPVGVSARG
ncbi:hypothetical protein [Variovorax boronicumulans]|uniref:Fe/B12 periplasmic-binding domain-containing protein n=1 Tax=Variovorax boronicumulans TaxID=436515 RepID=A0AAW8D8T8_9BURK|nr:hypothetical protein [Variovorax boronicumulans]MDP9897422.1 hypothetical protein [Variovorax boronicumulans]